MVAKINHGNSLYGTLMYNYEKVLDRNASIISGNNMINDIHGRPEKTMQKMMESFEDYLHANKRTEKPILHISLNPSPEDKLTDEHLSRLAKDYMDKMGYGDQPYVVFKHEDIDRHHIHIVSVNVDENGKKINDSFEWHKSMNACRELELIYGMKQITDKEKELDQLFLRKVDYKKQDLKHQVSNILKSVGNYKFQSFGEYNALLKCFNIDAKHIKGEHNGTLYNGITYSVTDDKGEIKSNPFKSSLFGKAHGYESLFKKMKRNADNFKNSKYAPKINEDIKRAIQVSGTNKITFKEYLSNKGIDTIFRENEAGRIYGVTFVDHNSKEVYNGSRLGKEFSANNFNKLFNEKEFPFSFSREIQNEPTGNNLQNEQSSTSVSKGDLLEQAFGIFTFDQHGPDYEEEAFRRKLRKKKKKKRGPSL